MPENTQNTTYTLATPAGREALKPLIENWFRSRDAAAAVRLLQNIEHASDAQTVRRELAAVLPKVYLLALPLLSEQQLAASLNEHLVALLDADQDFFLERVTIALESLPVRQRDALKASLRERLAKNNASLTDTALTRLTGQTGLPTVGNWLADIVAVRDRLPTPELYLSAKPNAASFSADDRRRVGGLMALVALLLTPSATAEGIEEEVPVRQAGRLGMFEHGRVRDLSRGSASTRPRVAPVPTASPSPAAVSPSPVQVVPSAPVEKAAARFYFHPEDEQEIQQHSDRLSAMSLAPSAAELAETVVDEIIRQHGLSFPDELLIKRFRTAMVAHLKGIRSADETKDLLRRDSKIGGLALPEPVTVAVLASAAAQGLKLHDAKGIADLQTTRRRLAEERAAQAHAQVATPSAPPPQPVVPSLAQPARPPQFQVKELRPAPTMVRPRPVGTERIQLQDIRTAQRPAPRGRTVGPVDELQNLTLEEFRSLGGDIRTAARKLKDKFDALAKESYSLRVQGIVGWRQSPLFKLYLNIGGESMNSRQPISAVIGQRQQRGEPVLTDQEFSVIADLNRLLRF